MPVFWITLRTVATMLLYAVPGYLLIRLKLLREDANYVCAENLAGILQWYEEARS